MTEHRPVSSSAPRVILTSVPLFLSRWGGFIISSSPRLRKWWSWPLDVGLVPRDLGLNPNPCPWSRTASSPVKQDNTNSCVC